MAVAQQEGAIIARRPARSARLRREATIGLLFLSPWLIGFVLLKALLHFFYIWNETRYASLYLGIAPNLQTVSFGIQRTQSFFFTPEILMVGATVVMAIPVVVLFLSQRFFMQDMVVTQIEK